MKRILGMLAPLALVLAASPASAQTSEIERALQNTTWQIGTGVDYSSGRYGASSNTTVLSVPVDIRVQIDRLRLEASIPYLDVKGPGAFTGGIVVGGGGASSTRSGIGDLTLGAAYLLSKDGTASPAFEIEGLVKVPTAANNLGTGKTDYTLLANIYHSFTPRFMLFGSAGYQWLSNFNGYTLENGVMASAGVNFKPGRMTSIGVSVNYREEYFHGLGEQFTVSPYLLWNFDKNWRISAYGTIGTTSASPRYGAGMRLIFTD